MLFERNQYDYPPFVRLISVALKHKDNEVVQQAANHVAKAFNTRFDRVLGPTVPLIARLRNLYLRQILIKLDRNARHLPAHKDFIRQTLVQLNDFAPFKSVEVQVDVDP